MGVYIRTGTPGRQPGANTLAYYPFTSDANDHSGNGYNGTISGTAITYGKVGGSTVNSAGFTSTRMTTSLATTPNTINLWFYYNGSSEWEQILGTHNGSGGYMLRGQYIYNNSGKLYIQVQGNMPYYASGNIKQAWHNICITNDSNGRYLYFDGSLVATGGSGLGTGDPFWIGSAPFDTTNYTYGNFSEVILESSAWTAQEVLDYYNQTKSNYGIS